MSGKMTPQEFGVPEVNESFKELLKTTGLLVKDLEEVAAVAAKLKKSLTGEGFEKQAKASKAASDNTNKFVQTAKELEGQQAKLVKAQAQEVASRTKNNKKIIEQQLIKKNNAAETRNEIELNAATKTSLDHIEKLLADNIRKYKNLTAAERANDKVGGKLLRTIQKQDKAVKNLNDQLGRSQGHVGNYGKALAGVGRQLVGALGITGGITMLVGVMKNAGRTIAQFDQAQSTLAATLGKSKDEIDDLTQSALDYGKATEYTATQVSQLQNKLAKLGFQQVEIKASTRAILDFASATGADLEQAASVAGGAVRGFGLSATETERAVSVMAVATTKSALSFEDYGTIIGTVAPIANKFGLEIEDTVAVLGKLRDAKFDASSSATAFRNILLKLSDPASALSKRFGGVATSSEELFRRLKVLKDEGVNLGEVLQLTDVRASAAFSTMIDNVDGVTELKTSITGVNDALADMVETKTDNVVGASKRLGSAWEGLILKFRGSSGVIKELLDDTATLINSLTSDTISSGEKWLGFFGGLGSKLMGIQVNPLKQTHEAQEALFESMSKMTKEEAKEFIEQKEEMLKNGNAFQQKMLKIAQERLFELEQSEIALAEREKERQDDAADKEKKANDKRLSDYKKLTEDINKLNKKLKIEDVEFTEIKLDDEDLKIDEPDLSEAEDAYNAFWNAQVLSARRSARDQSLAAGDNAKEQERIREELNDRLLELQKIELQEQLKNGNLTENERIEAQLAIMDIEDQAHDQRMANIDEESEAQKELNSKKVDLAMQGFSAISSIQDNRIARLEQEKQIAIAAAGDSTEGKIKAEAKYDKETRKIRRRQAILERTQAVFEVGLNTAIGVSNAASKVATLPLVPFIIGLGALQLAAVLSEPLPAFEKGGKVLDDTFARVSEKGTELATLPGGEQFLTPSSESIMYLPKGTEITPNDRLQQQLAHQAYSQSRIRELDTTNKYLKQIRDKKEEIRVDGKVYRKHKNIKGSYSC